MIRYISEMFRRDATRPLLGRWALRHRCPSEEIVVFNANRDHCGDKLCGDGEEYKRMVPHGRVAATQKNKTNVQ